MLPKRDKPKFKITIPSSGKSYTYRPYTIGEEKKLLISYETGDFENIIETINEVIEDCVEGISIKDLTYFDFQYIYIKLNMVSSGDMKTVSIKCSECGKDQPIDIDLNKIVFSKDLNTSKTIDLNDSIGITMRYPSMSEFSRAGNDIYSIISTSIENIYDNDTVYNVKDFKQTEIKEWIEKELLEDDLKKIEAFFKNAPSISLDMCEKCLMCGKDSVKLHLDTFEDFFLSP